MTERKRAFRGDRLRQARADLGLTQVDLADRLKASKAQVVRYESQDADPSIDLLLRLVTELNVSGDWLIGVPGASKLPTERPLGVSAIEMELIEALRDKDLERIFRVVVRALDSESPHGDSGASTHDQLEDSS